jgi:hypothetical protein
MLLSIVALGFDLLTGIQPSVVRPKVVPPRLQSLSEHLDEEISNESQNY